MVKKILYITYDGLTDPLGQSQIIPYLLGLVEHGIEIDVISCEKFSSFKTKGSEIASLLKKKNISWNYTYYHKSPAIVSTIFDLLLMKKKATTLLRIKSYDIVHCRSYLTALIGSSLKSRYGLKFVFDMRGFWVDERIEGNIWNVKNPVYKIIYRFFKYQEKRLLDQADHVVTLTTSAERFIREGGLGYTIEAQITSIPCCVDTDLFNISKISDQQILEHKQFLGISKESFILGYVGSLGTWYMLEEMLDFFLSLLAVNKDAIFLFITRESPELILEACKHKAVPLEKIKVVSSERKDVPSNIAIFDLSIFFIKPTLSKKASSPTKHAEIMAMGKPVICNSGIGDTDTIIHRYKCGLLLDQFNKESYDKICKALNMKFTPSDIRKGAEEFYSLQRGINLYEFIYNNVMLQ